MALEPMIGMAIIANANPMETVTVSRAQSILTMNGEVGPVLSYEQALDVVAWAERGNGDTP